MNSWSRLLDQFLHKDRIIMIIMESSLLQSFQYLNQFNLPKIQDTRYVFIKSSYGLHVVTWIYYNVHLFNNLHLLSTYYVPELNWLSLPRSSRSRVQGVPKVLWGVRAWRSGNYTAQRQVKHWFVYCKYKWIFIFSFLA